MDSRLTINDLRVCVRLFEVERWECVQMYSLSLSLSPHSISIHLASNHDANNLANYDFSPKSSNFSFNLIAVKMNWFYCFVIIQSTILLLHARPERNNPITFDRKLTLAVGNAPPEYKVETSPGEAAMPSKHLVANVYVEAPSRGGQSHKRLLKSSPHSFNSKKIDLDNNAAMAQNLDSMATVKQQTLVASSSTTVATQPTTTNAPKSSSSSSSLSPMSTTRAIVSSTSDIPKTRYNSKILSVDSHDSSLTNRNSDSSSRNASNNSNVSFSNSFNNINSRSSSNSSGSNNETVIGKHLADDANQKLENRQILYPTFFLSPSAHMNNNHNPSFDLNNRPQFVYNYNSLMSTTTVTPPSWMFPSVSPPLPPSLPQSQPSPTFITAHRPAQATLVLPQPEYYPVQHNKVQSPNMLNVETTFNSLPAGVNSYRPPPQPMQSPPTYPDAYTTNVTHVHTILTVSSTTPDPYLNYQKMQTRPIVNEHKVLKIQLSTPKPVTTTAFPDFTISFPNGKPIVVSSSKKPQTNNKSNKNNHNNRQPNKSNGNRKPNKGASNNKQNKNNNKNGDRNNKNRNGNQNKNNANQNYFESSTQTSIVTPAIAANSSLNRLCSITASQLNSSTDGICETANNLKIIIKFDADSLNSTREILKAKPAEPAESESDEDDESDEWEYFYDAPFGLTSLKSPVAPARLRRRRGPKPGGDHGHKDQEGAVNKYQTIILQTPRPHTAALPQPLHKEDDHWKHSLIHKFITFLPFLTLLKPLSFGFWTIALSPILVVAVSGIALAVVLYPWVTISKEHATHTALKRPPTVVIHKHQRPNRMHRKYPITIRPLKPTYSRRESHHDSMMQQRPHRPIVYDSYDEKRPRRRMGHFLRRNKRRANLFTGKYTFKDINFQHWLLVKNNFEVRHLTWNEDDDDTDYAR